MLLNLQKVIFIFETGSNSVALAVLEHSQEVSVRTKDVCHHHSWLSL